MAITGRVPAVVMLAVNSSLLAEVGYRQEDDLAKTGTLFVRFHPKKNMPLGSGALWGYSPVSLQRYEELMAAPSLGSFFIAQIRDVKNGSGASVYKATAW